MRMQAKREWRPDGKAHRMETCRLLLFDLDGTLLRSDKRITKRTLQALDRCREKDMMIGVSTSRGEKTALSFIDALRPDILIASGGALIKRGGEYIYKAEFSAERTRQMIGAARSICGMDCEITKIGRASCRERV